MPAPFIAPESESLTYEEAAKRLSVTPGYIADLVSKGVFHAVKLPGRKRKYLYTSEIDWYERRRQGSVEANPVADTAEAETEELGEMAADFIIDMGRWLSETYASGARTRDAINAAMLNRIRAMRADETGQVLLSGIAARLAGMLARGGLDNTVQERMRDLLSMLTSPATSVDDATKSREGGVSKR